MPSNNSRSRRQERRARALARLKAGLTSQPRHDFFYEEETTRSLIKALEVKL